MSFKNYCTDLLEIFIQSVKVYTDCVCEISQRFESNCVFEDQKIEITYRWWWWWVVGGDGDNKYIIKNKNEYYDE